MTVEDMTNWEEVGTVTLEESPESEPLVLGNIMREIPITGRQPHEGTLGNPREPFRFEDSLNREIGPGDILTWIAGRFYTTKYHNYGVVLRLYANEEKRFIRLRNTNKNEITIWNAYNTIILAKYGHYETIPEDMLNHLDIDYF